MSYLDDVSRVSLIPTCKDATIVSRLPYSYPETRRVDISTPHAFALVTKLGSMRLTSIEMYEKPDKDEEPWLKLIDCSIVFANSSCTLRTLSIGTSMPFVAGQLSKLATWVPNLTTLIVRNDAFLNELAESKFEFKSVTTIVVTDSKLDRIPDAIRLMPKLQDVDIVPTMEAYAIKFYNPNHHLIACTRILDELSYRRLRRFALRDAYFNDGTVIRGVMAETVEQLELYQGNLLNCPDLFRDCKRLSSIRVYQYPPLDYRLFSTLGTVTQVHIDPSIDETKYYLIPSVREIVWHRYDSTTFVQEIELVDIAQVAKETGHDRVTHLREATDIAFPIGEIIPLFKLESNDEKIQPLQISYLFHQ